VRLRLIVLLIVAAGVAATLGLGQAEAALNLAGYTWSD
jgi:hypothetical protein